jgi:tetratricopeptide (TPR) repeat protein
MSITTADSAYSEGNSFFVDEDYENALKCYNEAIELDDKRAEFYDKRAAVHYKLENYRESIKDADAAIQLKPTASVYLKKGFVYLI